MNDPQYVEAARHLAERIMHHSASTEEQLDYGFRLVTARHPTKQEMALLKRVLEKNKAKYDSNPEMAKQLYRASASLLQITSLKPTDLAAHTMFASLLLNLDETINKN